MYHPRAVLNWFHDTLGVDNQPNKYEVQTSCPECRSNKFYFNIKKLVGICHKASCGYIPTIEDLIAIVGFPPGSEGEYERDEEKWTQPDIKLPGWPILQRLSGQMMYSHLPAYEYLIGRGLTPEIILNWRMTCDEERIYLPIYSVGNLVNYNSRVLPGISGPKYLYCKGAKTSRYILGWEECRLWNRLSCVENSFVSLGLRSDLHCSTTFGSNTSDVQASLIGQSGIRSVAILWDEGAELKAEKAIRKLHKQGVKAAYWTIKGQPDDYPRSLVVEWGNKVFEAAENGVDYVDFKELNK